MQHLRFTNFILLRYNLKNLLTVLIVSVHKTFRDKRVVLLSRKKNFAIRECCCYREKKISRTITNLRFLLSFPKFIAGEIPYFRLCSQCMREAEPRTLGFLNVALFHNVDLNLVGKSFWNVRVTRSAQTHFL